MISVRLAEDRGIDRRGWLQSRHTFSFGNYIDPTHHHFRALRVINDDRIQPGAGFGMHPHRDMEILTWVLQGSLHHRDSYDHEATLQPGDAQRMSAGIGIEHSEYNPDPDQPCHLLQIWLFPRQTGGPPSYEQRRFPGDERRNRLRLIVSPDGESESLSWQAEARLHAALLDPGHTVSLDLAPGRHAWVHVASGKGTLNGVPMRGGDGAAVSGEKVLRFTALAASEVLVFDLA